MKKFIFLISLLLFSISYVSAYDVTESFHVGTRVPNVYVTKIKGSNVLNTTTTMLLRRDNNYVYCIDPFTRQISGEYEGYIGYHDFFGLTEEQINRINLLAHYGYGYSSHTDIIWYGVTQYLVWETLGLDDIYYTDTSYGNRITMFENEARELNDLVRNHYIVPSFSDNHYDYSIGREYTIIDDNNVLDLYDLEYSSEISVRKDGNKLIISSNNTGIYTINLVKRSEVTNDYIMYYNSKSQNMFYPGKYDDVMTSFSVSFYSGEIEIHKLDSEFNTPQGSAKLDGAVYGLYTLDDNLVGRATIEDGYLKFNNLPLDDYYIKEIKPSLGYMLDDTKYYVSLSLNSMDPKFNVYEDVIKNNFKIIKLYGNDVLDKYYLESDVSFELYDINNNYLSTYMTDEKGEINITLPYGHYYLKQIDGLDDFSINDVIYLDVLEMDEDKVIELKDIEDIKYGSLEVKKIGDDGNLLDGVLFEVYADSDIVSKTGDIYYQKDDLIGNIDIVNGYGKLDNLYYGNYYLKEVKGVDGYIVNPDNITFTIDSDITNLEVINEHIKEEVIEEIIEEEPEKIVEVVDEIPNTGMNTVNYIDIISNIMITLGFIIYAFKNKFSN